MKILLLFVLIGLIALSAHLGTRQRDPDRTPA
jgi:hypothetical protein